MKYTAEDIARIVNGTLTGAAGIEISRPERIEDAGEGSITFYHHPKYRQYLESLRDCVVLVPAGFDEKLDGSVSTITVENPLTAFAQVLKLFEAVREGDSISSQASVAPNVKLGEQVYIGEFSVISALSEIGSRTQIYPQVFVGKNVSIGNDCIIYPGVKIYDNCVIGDKCIIHAGVVIGGDGFGFAPQKDGTYSKIPQLGNVVIEDDVEIGANTTIDKAVTGSTIIRKGAKLDNLIMVGHNAEIGAYTVIAGQTGISGSTKVGERCQIGGQAGFAGHLVIAPRSKINAQSGFGKSIEEAGKAWSGSPAREFVKHYRMLASMETLPAMQREIAAIKEILSLLQPAKKDA